MKCLSHEAFFFKKCDVNEHRFVVDTIVRIKMKREAILDRFPS